MLDPEFPNRARERIAQLQAQLAELKERSPDAAVEDIAAARQLRAEVATELHETERALEEALRSLGESDARGG